MWSLYLRTRNRDKVVAIFHELHPDPIYCSSGQWNKIINGNTDGAEMLIDDLKERKLIVESREDDLREFESVSSCIERRLNQPTTLYLMTAQGCDFGCGYCPVPEIARKHGSALLSVEDAKAGIDLWQEHLNDVYDSSLQYFVIFYGGEPLLNKETIRASLAHLKMKKETGLLPAGINNMMVTNGNLIDAEVISLCQEYSIMVAVGLDGPKDINDGLRVDSSGHGTFDRIVATIKLLVENKVRTFGSASITPYNIDQISEYSSLFRELGVDKFGFNFLKGRNLLDLVGVDGLENYYRKAARGVIENARQQSFPHFEYQMEKKQLAFDNRDFYPVDCTCLGNQLVIQPDGQVGNCPFYKSWLGHVRDVGKDFRIWEQPIVKEWRKRLSIYHPGEAKALCGAGCAWSMGELKGDMLAVDDSSKIFSEEVFNELIWARYDRLNAQET